MTRQRLPIGIQDFDRLRNTNSYYVDKTSLIRELTECGDHWFLSRPRRFGKSLLVSTLKALFEGQEALFKGMDIHQHWDWSVTHPVVRISFDRTYTESDDIAHNLRAQLDIIERNAGLQASTYHTASERLLDLLDRLHAQTGQRVAVLVDEYDKPILDVLDNPEQARAHREYLRGFYGIIKGSAQHVRFVFVTGISMFSKVSLFSGLNNLKDISLDPRFATICGYTDEDIDTVFAPELKGLDRDMIRQWYNGYNWLGTERVYNPYDALLLFDERKFKPHWFETGNPSFLLKTLTKASIHPLELEGCLFDESLVSKFDVDDISAEALLFQSGYLTITEEIVKGHRTLFRLDYPNMEVELSLNDELLVYLSPQNRIPLEEGQTLRDLLEANDFDGFAKTLQAYLASIPYRWHITGDLARYEAWYTCLLHMCFRAIGVDARSEEASSRGQADMVVMTGGQVFVFEFKMVEQVEDTEAMLEAALKQMRERGYANKYRDRQEPVHLIAVVCSRDARNVLDMRVESMD